MAARVRLADVVVSGALALGPQRKPGANAAGLPLVRQKTLKLARRLPIDRNRVTVGKRRMIAAAQRMQPKIGLVLTGGGARAAYQVGVLRALAELVPKGAPSPFQIVCGTSAGAINATAIATDASNFRRAVRRLLTVWKNFHAGHVYRADVRGIAACGARWLAAVLLGGLGKHNPVSLLDNSPLAELLSRHYSFAGIEHSIDAGHLTALAITASSYGSGQSITFFEGVSTLEDWKRARRVGVRAQLDVRHLMASAAIPFIFPPVAIEEKYFGDGSMRQIAPISPSLHLGADRVLIVSVSRAPNGNTSPPRREDCPSLAQIGGHALNSIFIDALDADLERLDRINRTVARIPLAADRAAVNLKRVDYLLLSPSQELDQIAQRHVHALPWPVRFFLRGIGAMRRSGSNVASYVLFEKPFCRALIRLGYQDTMARRDEVRAFLGVGANMAAGARANAAPVDELRVPEFVGM
jgi:NTE family protein